MANRNPFLSLPVELRTRIYEAYFEEEQDVHVPALWDHEIDDFGLWRNQQPPITMVSRQIRAESLPTFYAFCTFRPWYICAPCIPSNIARTCCVKRPETEGEKCRYIPDLCYRQECRLSTKYPDNWCWLAGLGESNLQHIRDLVLGNAGSSFNRHAGYSVHVHQHPRTKRLTVSEDSFWQGDWDPHVRSRASKVLGSEPEGKAIIQETSRVLEEDETSVGERRPPTVTRIYNILDVSYQRSFGKSNMDDVLASGQ